MKKVDMEYLTVHANTQTDKPTLCPIFAKLSEPLEVKISHLITMHFQFCCYELLELNEILEGFITIS